MERNFDVRVRLTEEERAELLRKAKEANLPQTEYCRRALCNELLRGHPSRETGTILMQLIGIERTICNMLPVESNLQVSEQMRLTLTESRQAAETICRTFGKGSDFSWQ